VFETTPFAGNAHRREFACGETSRGEAVIFSPRQLSRRLGWR
jgi:hypothetical protein